MSGFQRERTPSLQQEHDVAIDPRRIEVLDPLVAQILRSKTPGERIRMTVESNRFVRARLAAHLRHEHADWTEDQVRAEVARRVLGGAG